MSIMNKFFRRGIIPLLLTLFIVFTDHSATPNQLPSNNILRINILSKHLESFRKNSKGGLNFRLPAGTLARTDDSETYIKDLEIKYANEMFRISAGERELHSGKYLLHSEKDSSLCTVFFNGEARVYPLPVEIIRQKNSIRIYISENAGQYAIDSAYSELGHELAGEPEALYALALAINARCGIKPSRSRHSDCDFCDLTCCQTYRGRCGLPPLTGPFIDTSATENRFFFHSSSGGRLFTESVFNSETRKNKPPADRLYSANLHLSREMHSSWEARLHRNEAAEILLRGKNTILKDIVYEPELEITLLYTPETVNKMPPEKFRLLINRKKGWNFIKSNNYTLTSDGNNFIFRGSGLGHCTGMSMEGAFQLASHGYSRYEILEHYYPDLKYISSGNNTQSSQYILYNINTGEVIRSSSGPALLDRRVPCGSIFKLFPVLYLAQERKDIFFNHKFTCKDDHPSPLPLHCWDKKEHGEMDLKKAVSNSCNIWFASLHDKIDKNGFRRWFKTFTEKQGISMRIPRTKNESQWCELLAGLNFRADIALKDIMILSIYINKNINNGGGDISPVEADTISKALRNTFISGTAKITEKDIEADPVLASLPEKLWGKTGTMIAGTNSHFSYGLFTGGTGEKGIIVLVRKGKGTDAAHLAVKLLKEE